MKTIPLHLGVTGHRPDKLGGYKPSTHTRLRDISYLWLQKNRPERMFNGMAQGWDIATCEAAHLLKIPVTAVIPFSGQEDLWPYAAAIHYRKLLKDCEEVLVFSPINNIYAFLGRNKVIVEKSNKILACWNGEESGGTWDTVKKAQKAKLEIVNLYSKLKL